MVIRITMPRSNTQVSNKRTKEGQSQTDAPLPKWGEPEILIKSGYILAVYEGVDRIDLQVYEALSDGRTIIEGLDVPKNLKISDFLKGFIYEFKIKMFKGELSSKLVELLKSMYNLDMNAIYKFELEDLQLMDVESDIQASSGTDEDED